LCRCLQAPAVHPDYPQPAERMSDIKTAKTDLSSWWMLAVLWMLYTLGLLDRFILTMLVDPIRADLGLSDFQISLILGPAFAISLSVAALPLGWAADRFKRRWVLFFGVVFWSCATMASGLAQSFLALLIARICVGAGEAALPPSAYSLIADRFPRDQLTTAAAIYQTAVKAGSALAFGVGGLLLTVAVAIGPLDLPGLARVAPWQMVMIMTGVPGLIVASLLFTFREPPRTASMKDEAAEAAAKAQFWPFLKHHRRVLTLMIGGFACCSVCSMAMTAWAPTFIGRQFGWTPLKYGSALSAISLLAALALVFKGVVVDWFYRRGMKDAHLRIYCWLLTISLPFGLIVFHLTQPPVFFAVYVFLQLVMISFQAYATAALSILAPPLLRGRLIALFVLCGNFAGSGIGATVVGGLTDFVFRDKNKIGLSLATTVSVAMPAAVILLWAALRAWRRTIAEMEAAEAPAQAAPVALAV
jgi:MFS family permease